MQDVLALAPQPPPAPSPSAAEDWLGMPLSDLEAMHEEALALCRHPRLGAGAAARHAASLALLQQLLLARTLVRALRVPAADARAAMRSDHALGYDFGLASDGWDRSGGAPPQRQIARTLVVLHDLVFGRAAAERLTADLVSGAVTTVGEAFADGVLAAAADLVALGRWLRGEGGALPGGLLDGLPWAAWGRDGQGTLPH